MANPRPVVALAGGVGGARFAAGLAAHLPGAELAVIVNTGDDFTHWGLPISPDVDTVMYTLADINNPETGWGLANETWRVFDNMAAIGGETWFRIGDRDMVTHLRRNAMLQQGLCLTQATASLCADLGLATRILPMCDTPLPTMVETEQGWLSFQDYFVRQRCQPIVQRFEFRGAAQAQTTPEIRAVFAEQPQAILIGPSNPFVSIDPIRAIPELSTLLHQHGGPIVAISPIVAGAAIKGPAAKMMAELGLPVSVLSLAEYYQGFINALVIDQQDAALAAAIEAQGLAVLVTDTIMRSPADRQRLAGDVLKFAGQLTGEQVF